MNYKMYVWARVKPDRGHGTYHVALETPGGTKRYDERVECLSVHLCILTGILDCINQIKLKQSCTIDVHTSERLGMWNEGSANQDIKQEIKKVLKAKKITLNLNDHFGQAKLIRDKTTPKSESDNYKPIERRWDTRRPISGFEKSERSKRK